MAEMEHGRGGAWHIYGLRWNGAARTPGSWRCQQFMCSCNPQRENRVPSSKADTMSAISCQLQHTHITVTMRRGCRGCGSRDRRQCALRHASHRPTFLRSVTTARPIHYRSVMAVRVPSMTRLHVPSSNVSFLRDRVARTPVWNTGRRLR